MTTSTTSTTSIRLSPDRQDLLRKFRSVRSQTCRLTEPLETEDMVIQTMPDVSPTKWHLAHTTWFFETLVLQRSDSSYEPYDGRFGELFNSYYQSLGEPYPREQRGLLSRPTVAQVREYRRHVDRALTSFIEGCTRDELDELRPVLTLGMHHEEQHQELLLMDVKHVLAANTAGIAYRAPEGSDESLVPLAPPRERAWCSFEGGVVEVGSDGCVEGTGFQFDNECPRHRVLLEPYALASHLVTAGEYLEFMRDGGYRRSELWLAEGWDRVQNEGWNAPLYWEREGEHEDDPWLVTTLRGRRAVTRDEPVCHVSYFEADAFSSWAGYRLPSEQEWEHAVAGEAPGGEFLESDALHPVPCAGPGNRLQQVFGDVWEWTQSPYVPYPGYRPFEGELGEYNGKFMVNQMVLRGGCCLTPERHLRSTYRNFYHPHQRWMVSGIRLARGDGASNRRH